MKWNALYTYTDKELRVGSRTSNITKYLFGSIIAGVPSILKPSKNLHLTLPKNCVHHFIYLHNMTVP